jgi:hypothetical protein
MQNRQASNNAKAATAAARRDSMRANEMARQNAKRQNYALRNPIVREGAGINFAKMREAARKGGFNPLSLMQMTGGAPWARSYVDTAVRQSGTYGEVVSQPGSVLAAGAGSLSSYAGQQMQFDHETAINSAQLAQEAQIAMARNVATQNAYSTFGGGAVAPMDAPVTGMVTLVDMNGDPVQVNAQWAQKEGYAEGDFIPPGAMTNYYGDTMGEGAALMQGGKALGSVYQQGFSDLWSDIFDGVNLGIPGSVTPAPASLSASPQIDSLTGVPLSALNSW